MLNEETVKKIIAEELAKVEKTKGGSMNKYATTDFIEEMCKRFKLWALYISWLDDANIHNILEAAPYLTMDDDYQMLSDCTGVVLCESEKEVWKIFDQTVGDEGATEANQYDGPGNVYACIMGPEGAIHTNT